MRVGFTGTQVGMTLAQLRSFERLFEDLRQQMTEFHHGDCVGSDQQSHMVVDEKRRQWKIIIHPPSNPSKRAFCQGDELRPEKDYLERNKDIVKEVDRMIATPQTSAEERRSGTWATVRHALKMHVPITIIWPDGSQEEW